MEKNEENEIRTEEEINLELSRKLIQRPGTSRRLGLLRLDYTFSVIVPCLMAIYLNNYVLWNYLDILVGFTLYAITGNTLNDVIDMRDPNDLETKKRTEGYHWKEILVVSLVGFIFGSMFFVRTIIENWINGVILVLIIGMVVLYCLKKDIPIINQILLGISHVFLPYIMIKIDAGGDPLMNSWEWFAMLTFFTFAFSGQIVHEVIDGDAITKFSPKVQQFLIIFSSLSTIFVSIIGVILTEDLYLLPFVIIPLGSIYTFRRPTKSTKGVKDVGIILGNVILIYFLVLILRNMLVL
ncbi:MAG: hypothetical protein GF364_07850 [Candidatus Lokiarchaeota archaeon]|nr:hypothetical protein [Candidatus Lokiarchaeota archaeon]